MKYSGLCSCAQAGEVPELDFDMDLPPWSPDTSGDASSTCTGNHETQTTEVVPVNLV